MLVLTRRPTERLVITGPAVIEVLEVRGSAVRFGVTADAADQIVREEVMGQRHGKPEEFLQEAVEAAARGGRV